MNTSKRSVAMLEPHSAQLCSTRILLSAENLVQIKMMKVLLYKLLINIMKLPNAKLN